MRAAHATCSWIQMRGDGIAGVARDPAGARDRRRARTRSAAIAAEMARFYASDVIYKDYARRPIIGALKRAGIGVGGATAADRWPPVPPNLDWLTPTFVTAASWARRPRPPAASRRRAPTATRSFRSASVARPSQHQPTNTVPASPAPTFTFNFTNQRQHNENNVILKVSIGGTTGVLRRRSRRRPPAVDDRASSRSLSPRRPGPARRPPRSRSVPARAVPANDTQYHQGHRPQGAGRAPGEKSGFRASTEPGYPCVVAHDGRRGQAPGVQLQPADTASSDRPILRWVHDLTSTAGIVAIALVRSPSSRLAVHRSSCGAGCAACAPTSASCSATRPRASSPTPPSSERVRGAAGYVEEPPLRLDGRLGTAEDRIDRAITYRARSSATTPTTSCPAASRRRSRCSTRRARASCSRRSTTATRRACTSSTCTRAPPRSRSRPRRRRRSVWRWPGEGQEAPRGVPQD